MVLFRTLTHKYEKEKGLGSLGFWTVVISPWLLTLFVSPSQINNGEAGDLLKASCGLKTTGKFQIVSV